jgi:hypothetical protein
VVVQESEYSSLNLEKFKKIKKTCNKVTVNFSYDSISNNSYLTTAEIKKLIQDNCSDFET